MQEVFSDSPAAGKGLAGWERERNREAAGFFLAFNKKSPIMKKWPVKNMNEIRQNNKNNIDNK